MGEAAQSDFMKWDTASGTKTSMRLHNINVRYSNKGLNIKAIHKTFF